MEFWANFVNKFNTAFVEGNRWKLYLQGLGYTVELTVIALIIGIILGVLVAVVRTSHDQQRLGHRRSHHRVIGEVAVTKKKGEIVILCVVELIGAAYGVSAYCSKHILYFL